MKKKEIAWTWGKTCPGHYQKRRNPDETSLPRVDGANFKQKTVRRHGPPDRHSFIFDLKFRLKLAYSVFNRILSIAPIRVSDFMKFASGRRAFISGIGGGGVFAVFGAFDQAQGDNDGDDKSADIDLKIIPLLHLPYHFVHLFQIVGNYRGPHGHVETLSKSPFVILT